ncbi:hypothetical protein [Streptomyces sasae]|uniref:hypothetical protein n=1 Tax=Streptomyces sasae TaxID=1266772 RepID=UPI00292E5170|nr:hypothetical protein [Streptomyces sasae]
MTAAVPTTCAEFAAQRAGAEARCDASAATDAHVLLRRHLRRDHWGGPTPAGSSGSCRI